MADVKLNTLPQSTSPTSTQDLLLFDESTNAGQRINYNTLADVILAKLTSKTYTVGGGTQTLISAIDALNSNSMLQNLGTAITNGTDMNTLTTIGNFYASTNAIAGSLQNKPSDLTVAFRLYVGYSNGTNGRKRQLIITHTGDQYWRYTNSSNSFDEQEWIKYPTRNEMNTVTSKLTPQFIQNITLSNTGAGDTGISSTDFYITQPVVTNKAEVYCQTFIYGGHWYIKVRNRNNDSVATGPVNIRLLKIPV